MGSERGKNGGSSDEHMAKMRAKHKHRKRTHPLHGSRLYKNPEAGIVSYKYCPRTLHKLVELAGVMPSYAPICREININRYTLKNWLKRSEKGDPGFMVRIDGEDVPFHVAFMEAIETGLDLIEEAQTKLALGTFQEQQTFKGYATYKLNPDLVALGFPLHECLLIDKKTGQPIPETIGRIDPEAGRFMLSKRRAQVYGDHSTVDVKIGGLLVIGAAPSKAELAKNYGGGQEIPEVEFEEVKSDE